MESQEELQRGTKRLCHRVLQAPILQNSVLFKVPNLGEGLLMKLLQDQNVSFLPIKMYLLLLSVKKTHFDVY